MYRLSPELAKEIMSKIKTPEIESSGPNAFLPKNFNSIGICDLTCAVGTDYFYILEAPVNIIYPELPGIPPTINGWFLYRKAELQQLDESWNVARVFLDPTCTDAQEQIDCREVAIQLPNDIDKLTCKTISSMESLIKVEPCIIDCLNL
jgi:hypothetical protein